MRIGNSHYTITMIIAIAMTLTGAVPSSYSYYGSTDNVPFVLRSPVCQGNESSLFRCVGGEVNVGKTGKYRGDSDAERNTVGVRCECKPEQLK